MKTFVCGGTPENPETLRIEVDRAKAFGILASVLDFIENIPMESDKAIFLTFTGEFVNDS